MLAHTKRLQKGNSETELKKNLKNYRTVTGSQVWFLLIVCCCCCFVCCLFTCFRISSRWDACWYSDQVTSCPLSLSYDACWYSDQVTSCPLSLSYTVSITTEYDANDFLSSPAAQQYTELTHVADLWVLFASLIIDTFLLTMQTFLFLTRRWSLGSMVTSSPWWLTRDTRE